MENVSGKDLDTFFDQWLYKGGIMKLDLSWEYNERKKEIEIDLSQVQNDGYLFEMPLEIEIHYDEKKSIIKTINIDEKSKKYIISSDYNPKEIKFVSSVILFKKSLLNCKFSLNKKVDSKIS